MQANELDKEQLHEAVEAVARLHDVINPRRPCHCAIILRRIILGLLPNWIRQHIHMGHAPHHHD